MQSRWFKHKELAVKLRKQGESIREIEKKLGIARSTLSGWLKDIDLTQEQKERLKINKVNNLILARKEAVKWHKLQKTKRLMIAKNQATSVVNNLDLADKSVMELALSMLYLGEGTKKRDTSLGNSNPYVLKYFIKCLKTIYGVDQQKMKCELHLRADHDVNEIKKYWSQQLEIPIKNFRTNIDKRTIGTKTYNDYKGVCNVILGGLAIQRRLSYIVESYFEKLTILDP